MDDLRVFIQARMSSARFPGKMLAPLQGRPLIDHVVSAARAFAGPAHVHLLTSQAPSDDPLCLYAEQLGVPVYRGDLNNVLLRFREALACFPATRIMRICGDSPFIGLDVMTAVKAACGPDVDLATTVFPRTFPKGQGVEIMTAAALLAIPLEQTTPDDREHVTPWFYRHAEAYRIRNVAADGPWRSCPDLVVDTVDDLRRLEQVVRAGTGSFSAPQVSAPL